MILIRLQRKQANNPNTGILIFALVLLFNCFAKGQPSNDFKRDFVWPLANVHTYLHSTLHFNQPLIHQSSGSSALYTCETNASICDTSGKLLFSTNGMYVEDSTGHIMPHGDSLSLGDFYNMYSSSYQGLPIPQGALILPLPGSGNFYYIFHFPVNYLTQSGMSGVVVKQLLYSIIDMNQNGGKGDIILKNQPLITRDSLSLGFLSAVRHANGRDWWILVPGANYQKMYRILLSPKGVEYFQQAIPSSVNNYIDWGAVVFSPDGNYYVRAKSMPQWWQNPFSLELYHFDRCTGLLSGYLDLTGTCDVYEWPSVAISPNSRFLYVSNGHVIDQFDLNAIDIKASKRIVANYDNFYWQNTQTAFWFFQLAPDNRIYIGANGTPYLHVINHPDSLGLACDVQQHSINLTYQNAFSLPNYPNFRLGRLAGSTCDSLYNAVAELPTSSAFSLSIYPNPATTTVSFQVNPDVHETNTLIRVFNLLGQPVAETYLQPFQSSLTFQTTSWPTGIYNAIMYSNNKKMASAKFIVQKGE